MKIAVLGFGNIGSGVVETLIKNAGAIAAGAGEPVEVKYICDIRDFSAHPLKDKFITDFNTAANDPEIELVAEMIVGLHPAYDFTKKALENGKHVVTSNKEVVAAKGDELLRIARERGVRYLYEASAGGTIPILRTIADALRVSEITEINGILNGTTNYILERMKIEGISMAEALKEAQEKGYAEAVPDNDISGADTARKICILASAAFGSLVDWSIIPCRGIEGITVEDIEEASKTGRAVKLTARAVKLENGKIHLSVEPMSITPDCPLVSVNGVYNAILLKVKDCGEMMFYGKGAGSLPTAGAVIADICDIVRHKNCSSDDIIWRRDDSVFVADLPREIIEETEKRLGFPI
ncbi:MAG: homoserine dehydrogenase [Clostridiales bacterium]|nr:homoserine dehydrogenase [Clostridiales bacterium]